MRDHIANCYRTGRAAVLELLARERGNMLRDRIITASLPCSISIIRAVAVIGFVIEATRKIASGSICRPAAWSPFPTAARCTTRSFVATSVRPRNLSLFDKLLHPLRNLGEASFVESRLIGCDGERK